MVVFNKQLPVNKTYVKLWIIISVNIHKEQLHLKTDWIYICQVMTDNKTTAQNNCNHHLTL